MEKAINSPRTFRANYVDSFGNCIIYTGEDSEVGLSTNIVYRIESEKTALIIDVQRYENLEEAGIGHDKWSKFCMCCPPELMTADYRLVMLMREDQDE